MPAGSCWGGAGSTLSSLPLKAQNQNSGSQLRPLSTPRLKGAGGKQSACGKGGIPRRDVSTMESPTRPHPFHDTVCLDPSQSRFRPCYGTETALVDLARCAGRDRGSATLLIFLELSVPFSTVDHSILLNYLSGLELGGIVLQWLQSYLEGRFHNVLLRGTCSAPWLLAYDVLQGFCLVAHSF